MAILPRQREARHFRLITRRYEKASIILTSNKSFVDWSEIFGDQAIATAILNRLLHQATTLNIKGESYRLKEKRKVGLPKGTTTKK
ncbi:IS21 family transposase [Endozoicomonas montiporae CL-33]|uniref:IS21 family transposase n=1 Tax=Endozoicomonas montiporae CL-33 TaxID=570277 RepID=A0A142BB92_9GAMM|nr:IS21 family transposase [Endozoicomonas montiporae CL-33]